MDCEADRRALLEALGGLCVRTSQGKAIAIFDNDFASSTSETGLELADRAPRLTMTSEDAERLGLIQGVAVEVLAPGKPPAHYLVRSSQPDGTGMTEIPLEAAA